MSETPDLSVEEKRLLAEFFGLLASMDSRARLNQDQLDSRLSAPEAGALEGPQP